MHDPTDPSEAASPWEEEATFIAPRTGGYAAAEVTDDDVFIGAFAVGELNLPDVTLTRVDSVSRQVVAGLNVRLELTLSDASRWRVVVYKGLDGSLKLTSSEPIPA